MAEPTTTAAMTFAAATATVPVLTAFGIPLGLRPDFLMAGFGGAIAAIILLDSVPSTGDTVAHLARTSMRRMGVAFASSLAAGYLTPMAMIAGGFPEAIQLGTAFAIGGGARQMLAWAIGWAARKGTQP